MSLQETYAYAPELKPETTSSRFYKNGEEHLADELLKLDALIYLQVLRFRDLHSNNRSDEFEGFYISAEEVDKVLGKKPKSQNKYSPSDKESEIKTLLNHVEQLQVKISKKVENTLKLGIFLPFHQLSHLFHLTSFELDTILTCLTLELDLKYEKSYAYLQDDITKKYPCVNLILNLLCCTPEQKSSARAFFQSQSPLLKYNLIEFKGDTKQQSLLSRSLKIDDRIANYLFGSNFLDSRIYSFAKIINPERDWSAVVMDDVLKEKLIQLSKQYFEGGTANKLIFYFCGAYGAGRKLIAEAFCRDLKLPLIIVDTRDLLISEVNFEKAIRLLFRETLLQPAGIYFQHIDKLIAEDPKNIYYQKVLVKAIEEFSFITFLAGEKPWNPSELSREHTFVKMDFPIPSYPFRKRLWKLSLNGQHTVSADVDIDAFANKFRITGGKIKDAIADARNLAAMRCGNDNSEITMEDLYQSCRARSNQKLSAMAQKIVPHYSWADIVLPSDKLEQLKEISHYVKYRPIVYDDWGFGQKLSLGKGLNVLFSGPSGTGKTLAAEIIANELKLDLYKIDLSCVVSKYIGETEKNLAKIFQEAEASNAILFFDEADALFGKRSEVKDSHDRYANIEINYLLQKMEEHEGIAILASNFRKNIDEAFTRRMHFSVEFPFPDEHYRLKIWRNIFPDATPISRDIDFEFLAKKIKISGGNIKNIALHAAFLDAEDSKNVNMDCVILATKREFQKIGKLCVQSDFGKYYKLVMPKGNEK
jgi:SpoVK/Ycf46/Vps4 family AAA+-type ATPase